MTPSTVLPPPDTVGRLLAQIVGKDVVARKSAKPLDLKAPDPKIYGFYRNAKTEDVAVGVMDYPLAPFSGGAMMLFPKDVVNAGARGVSSPGMLAAVQEILNVLAAVFHTALASHSGEVLHQAFRTAGGRC